MLTPNISNGSETIAMQLANLQWHDNSANDSSRANQGSTMQTMTMGPNGLTPYSFSDNIAGNSTDQYNYGGAKNLVLQHGLFSSPATWNKMVPWLHNDLVLGNMLTPGLDWMQNVTTESASQINIINSSNYDHYILIGHSLGGLVDRQTAQTYWSQINTEHMTDGVITVDTPNEGADILSYGINYIDNDLSNIENNMPLDCGNPIESFFCWFPAVIGANAQVLLGGSAIYNDTFLGLYADSGLSSAMQDMIPGSQLLNNLNAGQEQFTKVGVRTETDDLWLEMRFLGDGICELALNSGPDTCG